MNLPEMDKDVDNKLTEKIEKIMNETTMFNKSTVDMINIYFFYCVNNSLEQYTKIVVPLKVGILKKDELLTNILKHRTNDGRRFNINSIYAYQFDADIVEFLKNEVCEFDEHTQVEDIVFKPMVELFQNYSSLFIILNNEKTKHTRKIHDVPSISGKRKTIKNA
jgi:hypothetical protein